MNVFVSGGSKSGKSDFAQSAAVTLAVGGPLYYAATMIPFDREDRARIARHVQNRSGLGFTTLEIGRDISSCLEAAPPGATFLVDSVTALLLNEFYPGQDFEAPDPKGAERCLSGLLCVARGAGNAVFVSDDIFSDAVRYDAFTEGYRRELAGICTAVARVCGTVVELCAGCPIFHRGGPIQ